MLGHTLFVLKQLNRVIHGEWVFFQSYGWWMTENRLFVCYCSVFVIALRLWGANDIVRASFSISDVLHASSTP